MNITKIIHAESEDGKQRTEVHYTDGPNERLVKTRSSIDPAFASSYREIAPLMLDLLEIEFDEFYVKQVVFTSFGGIRVSVTLDVLTNQFVELVQIKTPATFVGTLEEQQAGTEGAFETLKNHARSFIEGKRAPRDPSQYDAFDGVEAAQPAEVA